MADGRGTSRQMIDPDYDWVEPKSADEWQMGPDVDLGQFGNNSAGKSPTQSEWEVVEDQPLETFQSPTQEGETDSIGQVWAEPTKTVDEPYRGPAKRMQEILVRARRPTMAEKYDPAAINVTKAGHYEMRQGRGGMGRVWVPDETDAETFGQAMSQVPGEIGTQFAGRAGGAEEYAGEELTLAAHKKMWQSLVLPQAVREWTVHNLAITDERDRIPLTEWPAVVEYAERIGIRPDVFARDWPTYVNMGPEQLSQIYKESVEELRGARELRAKGKALREESAQLSSAYRPRVDDWSAAGLAFDTATSAPDLLIAALGTVAAGPGVGLAAMGGSIAPGMYAQGRNMGLDHGGATGYGLLMTAAELAPEMPVLEAIARTPGAKRAMASMLGGFGESVGGRIAGTAALESGSEMITEALQIGIENGMLDANTSLADALRQIARAGVIGAGPGAAIGAITAPGKTRSQTGEQPAETRSQPGQADNAVPADEVLGPVEGPAEGPSVGEWEATDEVDRPVGAGAAGSVPAAAPGDAPVDAGGPSPAAGPIADTSGTGRSGQVPVPDAEPSAPVAEAGQGAAVETVADTEPDPRLADEGYRAAIEFIRRDVGESEPSGRLLRENGEEGAVVGVTKGGMSEHWANRPVFVGPKGGQRSIGPREARDAIDKVGAGKADELTPIQRHYIKYTLDEMEVNRKAWEAHQIEQAERHEEEIRTVLPDFDQQDDITQDLTMLSKVAAQHATEDEVMAALEAQDDNEAVRRLQVLIDRGWQARPQAEGEVNGEADESELGQPAAEQASAAGPAAGEAEPLTLESGGESEVPADRPRVAPPSDLFGANVESVDALNKRNAKVSRKLGEGRAAPPAETAPRGDIFREQAEASRAEAAAAQTDIEQAPDLEGDGSPSDVEQAIAENHNDATLIPGHKTGTDPKPAIERYESELERRGWTRQPGKGSNWKKGPAELFIRSQGTGSAPIVQWSTPMGQIATQKLIEEEREQKKRDNLTKKLKPRTDEVGAAADEAAASPTNAKPEPTPAQKEAGNYEKGHVALHGFDIAIENPKGSNRWKLDVEKLGALKKEAMLAKEDHELGRIQDALRDNARIPEAFAKIEALADRVKAVGHTIFAKRLEGIMADAWHAKLAADYGYIKGYIGKDKDHIDVYLGPNAKTDGPVYVMDQKGADGGFDEHKLFMGFASQDTAVANYVKSFDSQTFAKRIAGPITVFPDAAALRQWLDNGNLKKPAAEWHAPAEERVDVQRAEQNTESGRSNAEPANAVGQEAVPGDGRRKDRDAREAPVDSGKAAGAATSGDQLPDGGRAADGERGDQQVRVEGGRAGAEGAATGSDDGGAGADFGGQGTSNDLFGASDPVGASERAGSAKGVVDRAEKVKRQRAAEPIKVTPNDRKNIAETLPFLLEGQHDDVAFAEKRLTKPDGYGVVFTNGTGTGKTYTGLGYIKRQLKQGKKNGIVVVPSQKVLDDWVRSGNDLGITVNRLDDTKTTGKGVAITTFANFYANDTLADRPYDWVVVDEAHMLMMNAQAEDTAALDALRAITLHPDGSYRRAQMLHRPEWYRLQAASAKVKEYEAAKQPVPPAVSAEAQTAWNIFDPLSKAVAADVKASQGEKRPRAMFLSATPFAYEKNVRWANGYLFEWGNKKATGYNSGAAYEQFMMQHFGYRMRYNKLTEPEPGVDRTVMQRQFNTWLKKEGALSGRILEEPYDYDRKFVLIESKIGNKIDEGIEWIREKKLYKLGEYIRKRFDFLKRSRLLEALKARESIDYIKKQHALGRKVVVFYDFNEGGSFNVFEVHPEGMEDDVQDVLGHLTTQDRVGLKQEMMQFARERPDLVNLETAAPSPLQTLMKAFPNAKQYNGLIPSKKRTIWIDEFNDDNNKTTNLILAQKAANAGWSAHDTTGKHARVLINLGLPTAPVVAIQQEGRIYRVGQASDAMFRYFNTGTSWERTAFASTIARRASTAENLSMGELARGLKDSFIEAFQDSSTDVPGGPEDGKGGKAHDRALASSLSEFDRAKSFYFANQKRTSKTKSAEGTDYFATPEPLGFKMVEWAGIRHDESVLEPSAGHGAIARFFPELNKRTVIEPSDELASKLALATDAKLINGRFENLDPVNKFETIVMNPPFGNGGSTAIEHLDKAFTKHLREGGRIVAIIPEGPSADAKLEKWYEATEGAHKMADIGLPAVTFGRAGTSAKTHVVIIDKLSPVNKLREGYDFNDYELSQPISRREITADAIGDLFARIENMEAPARVRNKTHEERTRSYEEQTAREEAKKAAKVEKKEAAKAGRQFASVDGKHTKTGTPVYYAVPTVRTAYDEYQRRNDAAKELGGYYSSFGSTKGFMFKTAAARDQFIGKYDKSEVPALRVIAADETPKTPITRAFLDAHIAKISAATPLIEVYATDGYSGIKKRDVALLEALYKHGIGPNSFKGVHYQMPDGRHVLYLNARMTESLADAERTLFHEATHRGFRTALGDEAYGHLTNHLFFQMGGMSAFSREVEYYFTQRKRRVDVNDPAHRKQLVDEYLADKSQELNRTGITAKLQKLIDAILAWVNRYFRSKGWRRTFSQAEIRNALRSVSQIGLTSTLPDDNVKTPAREMAKFADDIAQDEEFGSGAMQEPSLSVPRNDDISKRQNRFWQSLKQGQYIERAVRLAFLPPGLTVNAKGEWTPSPLGRRVAARVASGTGSFARHAFGFMRPLAEAVHRNVVKEYGLDAKTSAAWETVKAGVVDRYGTPADFVLADAAAKNMRTQILDRAKKMVADLEASGMVSNRAEAEALQALLTGEATNIDAKMAALAEPIRQVVDQWGQEAVELGLLDKATFERNRATYLHRVYRKHEADYLGASGVVKRVDEAMSKHRRKIIGNQFKRRGISMDVTVGNLRRSLQDDWWGKKTDGKKIDVALGESEWIVLSKVKNQREGTADMINEANPGKDRVVDRVYWPADVQVPQKFAGWRNDGTFKAIKVTPTSVTLWRDFTKPERTKMGEILDMRYTFLKTALTAAHDLSTGRLFKQIAENPEWSRDIAPVLQDGTPAFEEAQPLKRKFRYAKEWVHVPDTNIPGTSTKRYGAMAGKYILSSIWRDMNELEIGMAPSTWKWILTQFKKNKTTRNPKTHIFNTMSNVILAYIDDMRASEWARGVKDWYEEGPMWQEARLHGVFGHDFVDQEIKNDVLKPLLEKILKESNLDEAPARKIKLLTRIFDGIHAVDRAATWAYQTEDELFRMASYMQARKHGMSPDEAAIHARRQFIDYDIRAPWINAMRSTAIPFISYTYRAIPRVMEAVARRPWKIATLALMTYAVNELAYSIMDDDDEDLQRRLMNENLRGRTWAFTPRMLRVPMNDEYGNPVFLDMRNGLPAANIVDFENSYSAVPTPAWMQIGGPLIMGVDFMQNYNAYRQEPISDREVDTLGQKTAAGASFLWSSYMPSWAPGGYAWNKVEKAVEGRMNQAHETSTIGMAIAQSVLPIRVESTEKNRRDRIREYERKLRKLSEDANDMRRDFQQLKDPDSDDREDLREALQEIESRRQQVQREMRDTLQGPQE